MKVLAAIFAVTGVLTVAGALGVLYLQQLPGRPWRAERIPVPVVISIGLVFEGIGVGFAIVGSRPYVFDLESGCYWKGKKPRDTGKVDRRQDCVSLDQIHALQLLHERVCSGDRPDKPKGKYDFDCYELILILRDGSRPLPCMWIKQPPSVITFGETEPNPNTPAEIPGTNYALMESPARDEDGRIISPPMNVGMKPDLTPYHNRVQLIRCLSDGLVSFLADNPGLTIETHGNCLTVYCTLWWSDRRSAPANLPAFLEDVLYLQRLLYDSWASSDAKKRTCIEAMLERHESQQRSSHEY